MNSRRACTLALPLLLVAAGCGFTSRARTTVVPDVTGEPLDVAEDTLDAVGLNYQTVGGGAFGIIVRSHWTVCRQRPAPGRRAGGHARRLPGLRRVGRRR